MTRRFAQADVARDDCAEHLLFEKLPHVGGHLLATRLTLTDAIRKDKRSVLDYGEVSVRELPDKYFDKNYMKTLD